MVTGTQRALRALLANIIYPYTLLDVGEATITLPLSPEHHNNMHTYTHACTHIYTPPTHRTHTHWRMPPDLMQLLDIQSKTHLVLPPAAPLTERTRASHKPLWTHCTHPSTKASLSVQKWFHKLLIYLNTSCIRSGLQGGGNLCPLGGLWGQKLYSRGSCLGGWHQVLWSHCMF